MFHMLDMRPGQPTYKEQLARAFEALQKALTSLQHDYETSQLAVRQPTFIPYPLQDVRWAEVQLLVKNKSLLFCASDAQTKAAKVIKYVTQYGSEVHQMLSNAGLAPILYQVVQLPGGFMQVEMELLAEEDGWMVLSSLSQEDLVLVAPAIWGALAKVHALSLPSGGAPVLADCRPCNVMVKSVGKSPEVRFIDFDWAGRAGHVFYPPFMNHRDDVWPTDIQEFAPALQKHDRRLLKRHLAHGPSAMMHTHPNVARQPKHRFHFLNASHRHAKMCPCAILL